MELWQPAATPEAMPPGASSTVKGIQMQAKVCAQCGSVALAPCCFQAASHRGGAYVHRVSKESALLERGSLVVRKERGKTHSLLKIRAA